MMNIRARVTQSTIGATRRLLLDNMCLRGHSDSRGSIRAIRTTPSSFATTGSARSRTRSDANAASQQYERRPRKQTIDTLIDNQQSASAVASKYAIAEIDLSFLPPTIDWKHTGSAASSPSAPTSAQQPAQQQISSSFFHPLQNLILHEDKHIIVVYKPCTILSQSSPDKREFNMFDAVRAYLTLKRKNERLRGIGGRVRVSDHIYRPPAVGMKNMGADPNRRPKSVLLSYELTQDMLYDSKVDDVDDDEIEDNDDIDDNEDEREESMVQEADAFDKKRAKKFGKKKDYSHYVSSVNRLDRPCSGRDAEPPHFWIQIL
jgi:hypothetical protein